MSQPASKPHAEPEAPAPAAGSRLDRLLVWLGEHRRVSGAIAALLVVGFSVQIWLIVAMRRQPTAQAEVVTAADALAALDARDFAEAETIARKLLEGPLEPADQGTPPFVLGAAAHQRASDPRASTKEQMQNRLVAIEHLRAARDTGFPTGREVSGLTMLGQDLFHTGQYAACRPVLDKVLELDEAAPITIDHMLCESYLLDAKPDLNRALEHNTAFLDFDQLTADERRAGLIDRARILLRQNDAPAAKAALEQIPPAERAQANVLLLLGEIALDEAKREPDRAAELYRQAIKDLRAAFGRDPGNGEVARRSMYQIGVGYLELGELDAALEQFSRTRKLHDGSAEGLAAYFHEADILRRLDRVPEALAAFRAALAEAGQPGRTALPWSTPAQLRERTLAAAQEWLKNEKYSVVIELTRGMSPFVPLEEAALIEAQTHRTWGRGELAKKDKAPPDQAAEAERLGREQLRQAGASFAQLAEARFATRNYIDDLWESAETYLEGRDYVQAAAMYRKYLDAEIRRRRPLALVGLGEALLGQNRLDAALEALLECVAEFPADPTTYRARLSAAKAQVDKGRIEEAEKLLLANLTSDALDPKSTEWRASLIAVGRLLFAEGRYTDAAVRLEEAIERYPDDAAAVEIRYMAAESYRQLARQTLEKVDNEVIAGNRTVYQKEVQRLSGLALPHYEQIKLTLAKKQKLTAEESARLRNCEFAQGSLLCQVGRYDEALRLYQGLINRYHRTPEVLDAYVQVAYCHRQLDRGADALGVLKQAKLVLNQIDAAAPFTETTAYNRQEWSELLDRLTKLEL